MSKQDLPGQDVVKPYVVISLHPKTRLIPLTMTNNATIVTDAILDCKATNSDQLQVSILY